MHFSVFPVSSQLGPNDCVDYVSMSEDIVRIILGTVCIECSVGDEVAADATFQIDNSNIDGVLVLFDTESVFTTAKRVQCVGISLNANHSVLMFLYIIMVSHTV